MLAKKSATPVILTRRQPDAGWLTGIKQADVVLADLSDDDQRRRAVREIRARHDRIDGLVNNAAANDSIGLKDDPQAFRDSLDRNLVHWYTLVHLLADDLRTARGSIVNVSSKTALTGKGGTSAYVAAKAAQLGLTREWARRLLAGRCPGQRRNPSRGHDTFVRQRAEDTR